MNITMDGLLVKARELPLIPISATSAYKYHIPTVTKYVDEQLSSIKDIHSLIGNNPLQVMFDNHNNHAAFMATVFSTGNYDMLCQTVPWVYRSYHSHHFSYDYFPLALKIWQEAISKHLDKNSSKLINTIYNWMIDNHEAFIIISQSEIPYPISVNKEWLKVKSSFQSSLITGNQKQCNEIAMKYVTQSSDIVPFYSQVIHPAMYEIGMLWEKGMLSVAQEHLASAIVGRIMATINMTTVTSEKNKGKAVITSSPNEFHEIGGWMIADILENEGWDVRYLGANTPQNDLVQFLLSDHPHILAISVTMPFNLEKAKAVIETVKNQSMLENMKIMVGGKVFNDYPKLWQTIGADGFAANIEDAIKLAHQWGNIENAL